MALDLDRLRRDAEAFLRDAAEEEYENLAGKRTESRLAEVYARHARLAEHDVVAEVASRRDTAGGPLAEFLVGLYAGRAAAAVADRLLAAEAAATLDLPGEPLTYRNAAVAIRNEADRSRREAIARTKAAVDARLVPIRAELWARTYEALAEVGHADYVAMCAGFSGIDYPSLASRLAAFTRETDDVYRDHLAYYLKKSVGPTPGGPASHDLARLLRAPQLDALFPKGDLLPVAEKTAAGLGLTLGAGGRITVDDEARPGKTPRAFCMPIEVPNRIVLVVMPQGGQDDWRAFLHELGHALHFAHAAPDLPVEARYLGDNSVTEGFAFLVEHLMHAKPWLRRHLGLGRDQLDDYLRFAHFERLYIVRRYGAKLAYELDLHADGGAASAPGGERARRLADRYREALHRAVGVDYPVESYLADVDPGFYSARYLRAWMFEAQLRDTLEERFDEDWFRNPRAGTFLTGLWAEGQPARLEALAERVGTGALDLAPLARRIGRALA
ncbi:MAG TPA: hypothetical protein VF406_06280 [Thermodesulfobacteriota bacterium]